MNEGFNWLRKVLSALNSLAAIHAVRGRIWLVGILILLLFPNAFAETDFSTFWNKFRSAIIAGDKAAVAEMTKFPVSMPYLVKAVKNKPEFLRRYNEIFKGVAVRLSDLLGAPDGMMELTVTWKSCDD